MGEGDARVGLEPRLAAVESTHEPRRLRVDASEFGGPRSNSRLGRSGAVDEDRTRAVAFAKRRSSPVRVHPRGCSRVKAALCHRERGLPFDRDSAAAGSLGGLLLGRHAATGSPLLLRLVSDSEQKPQRRWETSAGMPLVRETSCLAGGRPTRPPAI
jgi:hypothetical protein